MAGIIPTSKELVDALQPWLLVLCLTTHVNKYSEDPHKTLYIYLDAEDLRVDPRPLEALELLVLVGEIDYDAWTQAFAIAWPDFAPHLQLSSVGRVLRLGCQFRFIDDAADPAAHFDEWCERVVVGGLESNGSPGYNAIRTRLEVAYAAAERMTHRYFQPKPVARDQLVIPVRLSFLQGDATQQLRQILNVASIQHAQSTSSASMLRRDDWKPLLRLSEVNPSYRVGTVQSCKNFLYLTQIVCCGVDVNRIHFYGTDTDDIDATQLTVGLQMMMDAVSSMRAPTTRRGAAKAVAIGSSLTSRRAIAAIYSSLHTSQSVWLVAVNSRLSEDEHKPPVTRDDRAFRWRWIAFALFSRHATHRITTIQVNAHDLQLEDVESMRDVLEQADPAAFVVMPDQDGSASYETTSTTSGHKFITASRFQLTPPPHSSPSASFKSSQATRVLLDPQVVRCLPEDYSRDLSFKSVLLPGSGRAWVHCDDLLPGNDSMVAKHGRLRERQGVRAIPDVTFHNMDDGNKRAVLALLGLIGGGVTKLRLFLQDCAVPMDAWLHDVLRACPQLTDLHITRGGKLHSLDTIVRAFEKGWCRHLTTLQFSNVELEGETTHQDTHSFFQTLCDQTHPMTQQLQVLNLYFKGCKAAPRPLATALETVVATNFLLKTLFVRISFDAAIPMDGLAHFCISERGSTPIHARKMPLDLPAKLALLSVTTTAASATAATTGNPLRVGELDSRVLSLVFAFAARCHTRSVYVAFDVDDDE